MHDWKCLQIRPGKPAFDRLIPAQKLSAHIVQADVRLSSRVITYDYA